ncbi:hypothetical protein, partial [Bordetella pertussis]|uniref:hypothetical protein n=1 Tax=Bordetella pertussis TaxID=520 RepID=UPI0030C99022
RTPAPPLSLRHEAVTQISHELVGSEMCNKDTGCGACLGRGRGATLGHDHRNAAYSHLVLPT